MDPLDRPAQAGPGLLALVRQLIADQRALVSAEIELARARLMRRVTAGGVAIGAFAAAAAIAGSALTALLVGLILWIGQALGTGWAILIVIGVTLLVAGALGWFGTVKLRDALSSEDGV